MEKIKEENAMSALVVLLMWTVFIMLIFMAYLNTKIDTALENQMDIDQRLTRLEQSQDITDSIVVDALQKANECIYELKLK